MAPLFSAGLSSKHSPCSPIGGDSPLSTGRPAIEFFVADRLPRGGSLHAAASAVSSSAPVLIKAQASVNIKNINGDMALKFAADTGYTTVLFLLVQTLMGAGLVATNVLNGNPIFWGDWLRLGGELGLLLGAAEAS